MPETIGYALEKTSELKTEEMRNAVKVARAWFDHGRVFRQTTREGFWSRSEQQFMGNHWGEPSDDDSADLVVVNISFSTVTTIVPYVTGSSPRFLITPLSGDATIRNARAQSAWINRWWRTPKAGARRSLYDATHDHLVYGDGYAKVLYEMTENREGKSLAELKIASVSPWDLWLDPMSTGFHDARWVAQRVRMTLEELRADERYSFTDEVSAGVWSEINTAEDGKRIADLPATDDGEENENAFIDLIEFYDLAHRRLIVFTQNFDFPLQVVEDMELPIVQIRNHWLPKSPYHMGDLEQIFDLQMELNKSRSQMITHRRRNITKYLAREDALDDEAEEALMSEIVGAVAKIKGDVPLDQVIQAVNPSPLGADAYNVSDLITRDIFEITGVNEYLRGATPNIRRTATEASIIEGASNVKAAHKLTKVEELARDLGVLVLGIAKDVFPLSEADELTMYITGRDAEMLNKAEIGDRLSGMVDDGVDPDIISREAQGADLYGGAELTLGEAIFKGLYEVEVVADSTELRNPVFKEQKYREMAAQLTEATPILQQQGVTVNLRKVYELWFEAAGIQDIDDMFSESGQLPLGPQPQETQQPAAPGALPGVDQPNLQGLGPPDDLLSALNTGALAPGEQQPQG